MNNPRRLGRQVPHPMRLTLNQKSVHVRDSLGEAMTDLRLCGGRHVRRDTAVGRVRARVRRVPDRNHDERHNGHDERRANHEFDHFRTTAVMVKLS